MPRANSLNIRTKGTTGTSTSLWPTYQGAGQRIQTCMPMCEKRTYWPKRHGAHLQNTPPWLSGKTTQLGAQQRQRPLAKQSDPSTRGGDKHAPDHRPTRRELGQMAVEISQGSGNAPRDFRATMGSTCPWFRGMLMVTARALHRVIAHTNTECLPYPHGSIDINTGIILLTPRTQASHDDQDRPVLLESPDGGIHPQGHQKQWWWNKDHHNGRIDGADST